MTDELKEVAEVAAQMERQYTVFAKAHKVVAALKQAHEQQAALQEMIAGQKQALNTLKKQLRGVESRRKKATTQVAELEATAQTAVAERQAAITAVLQEHLPDIEEAARARAYAEKLAEAVYEDAIQQHENAMRGYAQEERAAATRVQNMKNDLQAMIVRATQDQPTNTLQ